MSIVTTWVTCGLVFTHKKKTPEGVLFSSNRMLLGMFVSSTKQYSCAYGATY